jgi:uncharacterized protein YndB with AHSA1/START domain
MTAMSTETTAVRVTRTIAAPPERVYRAWLDPELLKQWLAPRDRTAPRVEVEERPGGRFSVWHSEANGEDAGGMESEILELVPSERIVLGHYFVGPDRRTDPAMESRVTVSLREVDGGTELTVLHERLEGLRDRMPHVADQVTAGWNSVLDKLETVA